MTADLIEIGVMGGCLDSFGRESRINIDEDKNTDSLPLYYFRPGVFCRVRHIDFKESCATRCDSD